MSIKTILDSKDHTLLTIPGETTILQAAKTMAGARTGSVIVIKDGQLAGIFTERDLLHFVAESPDKLSTVQVKDVMTSHLTVASVNDSIEEILSTMVSKKFRHMPVMDGNTVVGLISIGDAVKDKLEKTQKEMHILKEFIGGSGQEAYIKP